MEKNGFKQMESRLNDNEGNTCIDWKITRQSCWVVIIRRNKNEKRVIKVVINQLELYTSTLDELIPRCVDVDNGTKVVL